MEVEGEIVTGNSEDLANLIVKSEEKMKEELIPEKVHKCGDPSCKQDANANATKRCSHCKNVFYCGKQCQNRHWKIHREVCGYPNAKSKNVVKLDLNEEKLEAEMCFELIVHKIFTHPEANWWWHSMSKLFYMEVLHLTEKREKGVGIGTEKRENEDKNETENVKKTFAKTGKEEEEPDPKLFEVDDDTTFPVITMGAKGAMIFTVENLAYARMLAGPQNDLFNLKYQGYCVRSTYLMGSDSLNPEVQKKIMQYNPATEFCVCLTTSIAPNYDATVVAIIPRTPDPKLRIKKKMIKLAQQEETKVLKDVDLREKHLKNLEVVLKERGIVPSLVEDEFMEMYETYAKQNMPYIGKIGCKDFMMVVSCVPTKVYKKGGEEKEKEKEVVDPTATDTSTMSQLVVPPSDTENPKSKTEIKKIF